METTVLSGGLREVVLNYVVARNSYYVSTCNVDAMAIVSPLFYNVESNPTDEYCAQILVSRLDIFWG